MLSLVSYIIYFIISSKITYQSYFVFDASLSQRKLISKHIVSFDRGFPGMYIPLCGFNLCNLIISQQKQDVHSTLGRKVNSRGRHWSLQDLQDLQVRSGSDKQKQSPPLGLEMKTHDCLVATGRTNMYT